MKMQSFLKAFTLIRIPLTYDCLTLTCTKQPETALTETIQVFLFWQIHHNPLSVKEREREKKNNKQNKTKSKQQNKNQQTSNNKAIFKWQRLHTAKKLF